MKSNFESRFTNAAEVFETYKDKLVTIPNAETGKLEEWKVVGGGT